jgi:glycosyltransferase involved in cell wall biosynthesis
MFDRSFQSRPHDSKRRILFIGYAESSHTHAWIDLLRDSSFAARLFALPTGLPPDDWEIETYITVPANKKLNPRHRKCLYPRRHLGNISRKVVSGISGKRWKIEQHWLAKIIRKWQPHIIHTLGLDSAAYFYFETRRRHRLQDIGRWVLQLRGGSDLELSRHDPERWPKICEVLKSCDRLLSDNQQNLEYTRAAGVGEKQLPFIGPVPGTGGIDLEAFSKAGRCRTSSRRMVLLPKAYECTWSKVLPVYEALRLAWEQIQPCEIWMLSMNPEARMWYLSLPENIRRQCCPSDRLPRNDVLDLMSKARVMLAPSLVDGTPNSLFEAMASGAFPVVSPLETIASIVQPERNVLFARNLYPEEIATALARAMNDDNLVDQASDENFSLVRKLADRSEVRKRILSFYEDVLRN